MERFDIVSPNQGYITSFYREPKLCPASRDLNEVTEIMNEQRVVLNMAMDDEQIPQNHPMRSAVMAAVDLTETHVRQEIQLRINLLNSVVSPDPFWLNQVENVFETNMYAICQYGTAQMALAMVL